MFGERAAPGQGTVAQSNSIPTSRFVLRPLRPEDVTETYSGWFDDPEVAPHILAARNAHDVSSLRRYVEERIGRDDVLFLGIFTPDGVTHIGNIKYEPVNGHEGFAVMGILIGDRAWRGRGVAGEVIVASARWLQTHRGVREILLGVAKDHRVAIAAYEQIGFRIEPSSRIPAGEDALCMVWHLDPSARRTTAGP